MEENVLYIHIAETIRREILEARLKPGERLPTIRKLAIRWNCTPGTIQRAYHELARQGLVTARVGQGTRVAEVPAMQDDTALRRAALFNRADLFLLEAISSGYQPAEIEQAITLALDRWKTIQPETTLPGHENLLFVGSHDPAVNYISTHFSEIAAGYELMVRFGGSLAGLIALTQGNGQMAGCHLWDETTDTYNIPFVKRLLPGRKAALVTLAERRLGLITAPKNPLDIHDIVDLSNPKILFINRQPGSGTRVWLDVKLRQNGINPAAINGYSVERLTHTEAAREIAEGRADVTLGLQTAALAFDLEFIPLTLEQYDLVIPIEVYEHPAIQALHGWLDSPNAKDTITALGGYETTKSGKLEWVN